MDVLAQWDVLIPELKRLAAKTTPAELDDQTPCEEWKLRDLFAHLTGGAGMFAAAVRGREPAAPPAPADDEVVATMTAAADDLDAAFREPGALERTVPTPFGEMPGDALARLLAFDVLMHIWDLATTTGQTIEVPGDVVAAADAFARQAVTSDLRQPGVFGAEVTPPADASPLERLVAFSGRTP